MVSGERGGAVAGEIMMQRWVVWEGAVGGGERCGGRDTLKVFYDLRDLPKNANREQPSLYNLYRKPNLRASIITP